MCERLRSGGVSRVVALALRGVQGGERLGVFRGGARCPIFGAGCLCWCLLRGVQEGWGRDPTASVGARYPVFPSKVRRGTRVPVSDWGRVENPILVPVFRSDRPCRCAAVVTARVSAAGLWTFRVRAKFFLCVRTRRSGPR